jgi:hypothetical protein
MRYILSPLLRPHAILVRFGANPPNEPPPPPPTPPSQPAAGQGQNQQQRGTNRSVLIGVIVAVLLLLLLACVALAPGFLGKLTGKSTPTPTHASSVITSPSPSVTVSPSAGLLGQYYSMPTLVAPQAVPEMPTGSPVFSTVDFTPNEANFPAINGGFDIPEGAWGVEGTLHYPHPELGNLGPNGFAVRWTGTITATETGSYTFSAISDDGVRVWVNGELLIDNWTIHGQTNNCSPVAGPGTAVPGPTGSCTSIYFAGGQAYSLKVEYYENNVGGSTIQLNWQATGMAQPAIVPDSALSH